MSSIEATYAEATQRLRGGYVEAAQGYADHTFCLGGRGCSQKKTQLI